MFHRNNLQPISYKTIYCVLYCVCYVMLSSVCGSGRKSLGTVKYFSCFFSACGAVCVCLWSVRSLSSLLNVYSCKLRRRQFSVRVTSLSLSFFLSHSLCLVLSVYWLSGCLAVWCLVLVRSRSKSVLSFLLSLRLSSNVFNLQGCHQDPMIRWGSHQWTWILTWDSLYATLCSLQLTRRKIYEN